jgi:hypothetical protein
MMTMQNLFSADNMGKLFEPDAVLTAQYYATMQRSLYRQPELRLMAAVLEDAVACLSAKLRHGNVRQRKQYEAARDWIMDEEESEWIFSFQNVCETLGMDPSYLRQQLIRSPGVTSANLSRAAMPRVPGVMRHKKVALRTGA